MERGKAENDVAEGIRKYLIVNDVKEHMTLDWVTLFILPHAT